MCYETSSFHIVRSGELVEYAQLDANRKIDIVKCLMNTIPWI